MIHVPGFLRHSLSLVALASAFLATTAFIEAPRNAAHDAFYYEKDSVELWELGEKAINTWDFAAAERILRELQQKDSKELLSTYLAAKVEFHKGNYKEAADLVRRIRNHRGALPSYFGEFFQLVSDTAEVAARFQTKLTRTMGRFVVTAADPKDEVLYPYLEEALPKIFDTLTKDFGYVPSEPVRLEIYPSVADFTKVSTLSRKDVETSHTIALCKFNRLMIVSPRVLWRGYEWVDTVAHEFVHYLVIKKTANAIPIWLHEGLAKYFQERWKGVPVPLDGKTETVLAEMLEQNAFVSFAQMHPSMAKLKTEDDVARAFAEVFYGVSQLVATYGIPKIEQLLALSGSGKSLEEAFRGAFGLDLPQFEGELKKSIAELHPKIRIAEFAPLSFTDQAGGEKDQVYLKEKKAKDYVHLGDLLRDRKFFLPAAAEYEKASAVVGHKSPETFRKMGMVYFIADKRDLALNAFDRAIALGPLSPTVYLLKGRILLDAGRVDEALAALHEGGLVNPFIPDLHQYAAQAYQKKGDAKKAERATRFVRLLSRD